MALSCRRHALHMTASVVSSSFIEKRPVFIEFHRFFIDFSSRCFLALRPLRAPKVAKQTEWTSIIAGGGLAKLHAHWGMQLASAVFALIFCMDHSPTPFENKRPHSAALAS